MLCSSFEELCSARERLIAHQQRNIRYYDDAPDGSVQKVNAVTTMNRVSDRIVAIERKIDQYMTDHPEEFTD